MRVYVYKNTFSTIRHYFNVMPNVNTYFEALYIQEATHQLHTITHNSAAHCCDFATDVVRNYFTSTAEVLVSI